LRAVLVVLPARLVGGDELLGAPVERWHARRWQGSLSHHARLGDRVATFAPDIHPQLLDALAGLLEADLAYSAESVPPGLALYRVPEEP